MPHPEPIDTLNPELSAGDEQPLRELGNGGISQGFIDDIQGLLSGK
jgi:hypothetical protein